MEESYLRGGDIAGALDDALEALDEAFDGLLTRQDMPSGLAVDPAHHSSVTSTPEELPVPSSPTSEATTSIERPTNTQLMIHALSREQRLALIRQSLARLRRLEFRLKHPTEGVHSITIPKVVVDRWLTTEPRCMWVPLIAEYVRRNGHEVDAEAANEVFERRILDNSRREHSYHHPRPKK